MSTSAETTVLSLAQQLQKRVQQFKDHIYQLTIQAAALTNPMPAVTLRLKVKKPEPYDSTGNVQSFLT
ncbi:hypothetical protein DL768_008910 [Monosporascus sp. mg162]|nr:hypothetical protein DL768_008910 [Monosporascus sp. mg162]